MTTHPLPAPCGLDCAACDIFQAARDPAAAERLAAAWRSWNPEAKPEWFRCQGCKGDPAVRWCEDCRLAACCSEKQLQDCSLCADFPCPTYHDWIGPYAHHQAAFERLQARAAARKA